MFEMTPGERRGAFVVLALCALGTLWDLAHVRPAPGTDLEQAAPVTVHPGAAATVATPQSAAPRPQPMGDAGAAGPVDLNAADARALDALPGIGPVLAGRIVEHRRTHGAYGSVDELLAVQGIGPRLLERLRPLVTARGGTIVRNATGDPR